MADNERMMSEEEMNRLLGIDTSQNRQEYKAPQEGTEDMPRLVAGSERPLGHTAEKESIKILLARKENQDGSEGSYVVIKSFKIASEDSDYYEYSRQVSEAVAEIQLTHRLARTTDAAFVQVEGYKIKDKEYLLVMPYYEGKTLDFQLTKNKTPNVSQLRTLIARIGGAVVEMHKQDTFHGDLWANNVLFAEDGNYDTAVLSDFGTSNKVSERFVGTPFYMDDESLRGRPVHAFRDVYGFSAMLYRTITGELAPYGEPQLQLRRRMHQIDDQNLGIEYWSKELGVSEDELNAQGNWRLTSTRYIMDRYLEAPRKYVPLTPDVVPSSYLPYLDGLNEVFAQVFSQAADQPFREFAPLYEELLKVLPESLPDENSEEQQKTTGLSELKKRFANWRKGLRGKHDE